VLPLERTQRYMQGKYHRADRTRQNATRRLTGHRDTSQVLCTMFQGREDAYTCRTSHAAPVPVPDALTLWMGGTARRTKE